MTYGQETRNGHKVFVLVMSEEENNDFLKGIPVVKGSGDNSGNFTMTAVLTRETPKVTDAVRIAVKAVIGREIDDNQINNALERYLYTSTGYIQSQAQAARLGVISRGHQDRDLEAMEIAIAARGVLE